MDNWRSRLRFGALFGSGVAIYSLLFVGLLAAILLGVTMTLARSDGGDAGEPSVNPRDFLECATAQLGLDELFYGLTEEKPGDERRNALSVVYIYNVSNSPCRAPAIGNVRLLDEAGSELGRDRSVKSGGMGVLPSGRGDMWLRVRWTSWCSDPPPGPLHLIAEMKSGGVLEWELRRSIGEDGRINAPPCDGSAVLEAETEKPRRGSF